MRATLPLVRELIARGHRVRYVTGPATAEQVRHTGAETIELPLTIGPLVGERGFSTDRMAEALDGFVDDLRQAAPALVAALRSDPPDLICHDAAFIVGASVAAVLGLPDLRLVPGFAENARVSPAARMAPYGLDRDNVRLAAYERNAHLLGRQIAPPRDPAGTPSVVFIPRSFQIDGFTFDDSFTFVGPEPHPTGRDVAWTPPHDGTRVLYVALHLAPVCRPDFLELCVNAFTDTAWHVVMAVGRHVGSTGLSAPANFEIAERFAPGEVLRHAAVFMTHAGMSSLMDALLAGVPVVALPVTPEQRLNSARLTELGAGLAGDLSAVTAAGLRELAGRLVVEPAFRRTLTRHFGRRTRTGGASLTADIVERQGLAGRARPSDAR